MDEPLAAQGGLLGPAARAWFEETFGAPTRIQSLGLGPIARGEHALLSAPTGSGKTLAAFLACLDRLGRELEAGEGVRVLYVSPLKALAYDIERNLRAPLEGMRAAAARLGVAFRPLAVSMRTGDTPPAERRRLLRAPGDLLITTPESLYLLLGTQAREVLRTVDTVIVDEIHALAPTKRGVHLALSLERLVELTGREPQRIGLSATQRPLDEVARFLGGSRPVTIVDASETPRIDLTIEVPLDDMTQPEARQPPRGEGEAERGVWPAIEERVLELIRARRSTIVFTNSRRLCERLAQRLNERAGEPLVRAHHGSIARAQRVEIEEQLKSGALRGIVATSSLELGIDMGAVDLVCQIETPATVAQGLQRIGRSGHRVSARSEGRVFPKHRGDLLEAAVVARLMLDGEVEAIRVPSNPLDVLAQQIVAMCSVEELSVDALHRVIARTHSFRRLSRDALESVLDMLAGRFPSDAFADLRPRLIWDRARDRLVARRDARLIALANGGTIPDRGLYGVYLADSARPIRVGELDEEMVYESRPGQTFLLGATSWRIVEITRDRVLVKPAPGEPGRMPFWRGEGPGRPVELGAALGAFTRELGDKSEADALAWLGRDYKLDERAARNLFAYVQAQKQVAGALPTDRTITVERFRDELGDWRVLILSPFGARVHAPWALALEARLGGASGYALQSLATDDGVVLRFADADEPPDAAQLLFAPDAVEELVLAELARSPLYASHFRENAARALLLPRRRPGARTPLWLQRLRAQTLLAAARAHPRFPIVLETYRECLEDVFDVPGLVSLMERIRSGEVLVKETPGPSPFARSLAFAWVAEYLYEGDAPAAERRAQALTLDRELLRELLGAEEEAGLLDPEVIAEVEAELQSLAEARRVRSADALHDLLRRVGDLSLEEARARAVAEPAPFIETLRADGRAESVVVAGETRLIAAEDTERYREAFIESAARERALEGLAARFARTHGPFAAARVAARFGLPDQTAASLLDGLVAAGRLDARTSTAGAPEYCDPEVMRLIRRRTLARLRAQVAPVPPPALARFLADWQGVGGRGRGIDRLRRALQPLEGLPFSLAELDAVLSARLDYQPQLLDQLCASGEWVFVGAGADGQLALYRRERVALLAPPAAPPPEGPLHRALLDHLQARGASFFVELQGASGGAPEADVLVALWDLVWAGLVTNDTLAPVRARDSDRPARYRVPGTGPAGGRWSLVAPLRARPVTATEVAHARALMLLDRYGVVSREAALAEDLPGGFAEIQPVLRAMEEAGKVRRGYFVDGLSGAQYALPGAVERLRATSATAGAQVLAATDPANPYGALLPWPASAEDAGPDAAHPRRVAGAKVVLARGVPVFFLEAGGRTLGYFEGAAQGEALTDAIATLATAAGATEGKEWPRIESINGVPALRSAHATLLERAGFRVEPGGLVPRAR